ncbi:MAG: hypothetical protein CTY19_02740 [Methylomonas sp.]|nr:MAG: hypothetical protein CTY19_02740 [Methylomonas sp.]
MAGGRIVFVDFLWRLRRKCQSCFDHRAALGKIEYRHELESCTCGQCGQTKIGEDIAEQLDV